MRNFKKWPMTSISLLVLCFTGASVANGKVQSNHGKACFVQLGGTGNGTSANKPYGSLQQVENDSNCKVIHVLPSPTPLDGGITLKDGQKLIGSGKHPMITNTLNADTLQAGPVIRLANSNQVQNLKVLALSIGVLGNNVSGVMLSDLLITKAISYPRTAVVDPELCDLTNAVYRGCNPNGVRNGNGGIHLLADDLGINKKFSYQLNNIIIEDIADSLRWADGVYVVAAGNSNVKATLNDVHVENVARGYEFIGFNTSKLSSDVINSSSMNSNNDALDALTSFFTARCPNCPTSDPTLIVNIDGFTATPQPVGGGGEAQGIETFSFELNKGTHEIHIANTSLSGFSAGVFVWNLNGYPKSAIYDLGCLNPNNGAVEDRAACIAAGYTSHGNNRIFGNNAFGVLDPGYNPGMEILTDGKADVMAQNNYWGPYSPGRITVLVNGVRRCGAELDIVGNLIRDVPPYRCEINQGNPTTGFATINDDFPQF